MRLFYSKGSFEASGKSTTKQNLLDLANVVIAGAGYGMTAATEETTPSGDERQGITADGSSLLHSLDLPLPGPDYGPPEDPPKGQLATQVFEPDFERSWSHFVRTDGGNVEVSLVWSSPDDPKKFYAYINWWANNEYCSSLLYSAKIKADGQIDPGSIKMKERKNRSKSVVGRKAGNELRQEKPDYVETVEEVARSLAAAGRSIRNIERDDTGEFRNGELVITPSPESGIEWTFIPSELVPVSDVIDFLEYKKLAQTELGTQALPSTRWQRLTDAPSRHAEASSP